MHFPCPLDVFDALATLIDVSLFVAAFGVGLALAHVRRS
jgi:hypothetical protein